MFKYIIIGDSGVGKTCLQLQFIHNKFKQKHDLTMGADYVSHTIQIQEKNIKLSIWDMTGQESFKSNI